MANHSAQQQYPLSQAQRRIWVMSQLSPDSPFYNISLIYDLEGDLDENFLELALLQLIQRHTILRTTFDTKEGQVVQTIHEHFEFNLNTIVLEGQSDLQALDTHVKAEIEQRFDLRTDLPMRATLIKKGDRTHTLILLIHHIVTDMWSMDILCSELGQIYNGLKSNGQSLLSGAPAQYYDYVLWESGLEQTAKRQADENYWKQQPLENIERLHLPLDFNRTNLVSYQGAVERLTVAKRTQRGMLSLARDLHVTPFMFLLGVYAVWLNRTTQQTTMAIGTFLMNRHRRQWQDTIGPLLNTLPVILQVDNCQPFSEFLIQVRNKVTELLAHSDFFFEDLSSKQSIHTLLNATFQLYQRHEDRLSLQGVQSRQRRIFQGTKFDLMLYGSLARENLDIWFNYNADLFSRETIHRFLGHYNALLVSVTEDPDKPIGRLNMLHQGEKHQLVHGFNQTTYPYPRNKLIHELVADHAAAKPNETAVFDHVNRLSYKTLDVISTQLANILLTQYNVQQGSVIGVLVPRSTDVAIANLAILKAGGVSLLLDSRYPQVRLQSMLDTAQAQIIVSRSHILKRLQLEPSSLTIDLDEIDLRCKLQETPEMIPHQLERHPTDPAFIVFTSGSSGNTKGVVLHHRGVINQVYTRLDRLAIDSHDTLCLSLSIAFSTLPLQLFTPLIGGLQLVIYNEDTALNSLELLHAVERDSVTVLEITPSMLRTYLNLVARNSVTRVSLPDLRVLMTAGEKLTPDLANRFFTEYEQIQLMTTYGQSECSGIITVGTVERSTSYMRIFEGTPSNNNQVYILDQDQNLVPPGVVGTVFFSGDSLSNGYVNNPTETAHRFTPNPFLPGEMMVNTGDLARWTADGRLEVVGREDSLVKVRGNRVELREVEQHILRHALIQQCVVVARELQEGQLSLIAYYVTLQPVADSELRAFLQALVPDYMVPNHFVELAEIPLSPNNKLDKLALPVPTVAYSNDGPELIGDTECEIASIWQELLSLPDLPKRDDNFFSLGGHSLLALEVIAMIEVRLDKTVSIVSVFEYPTIVQLAAFIEQG